MSKDLFVSMHTMKASVDLLFAQSSYEQVCSLEELCTLESSSQSNGHNTLM